MSLTVGLRVVWPAPQVFMKTECCVCADQGVYEDDDDDDKSSFYWRGSGQCNTYSDRVSTSATATFSAGCAYTDSEYIRNHTGKSYAECGVAPWNLIMQDFQVNGDQGQGDRFTSRMWFTVCFVMIPTLIGQMVLLGSMTLGMVAMLLDQDDGPRNGSAGFLFTPFAALATLTKFFDVDGDNDNYFEQVNFFGVTFLAPAAILSGCWYSATGNHNTLAESASEAGFWLLPVSLGLLLNSAAGIWTERGGNWEKFKGQLHYGSVRPIVCLDASLCQAMCQAQQSTPCTARSLSFAQGALARPKHDAVNCVAACASR